MSKQAKIVTAVVLALMVVVISYVVVGGSGSKVTKDDVAQQNETKPAVPKPSTTGAQAGLYTDYSEAAVAANKGTKVLFFHAPWCPQCRQLDASIKAGVVPDGVTIYKTDYDSNQALRKTYGVTIQTTVVAIDADGKLIKKYVAYDQPTLAAVVKNLLP